MIEHMSDNQQTMPAAERRTFLQMLTYGLSAVAGVVLSVPLIGYFLGVRPRPLEWVPLDRVTEFPVDETRMQIFDNPLRQPWDGMTALTGVYVRNLGEDSDGKPQFLVFAVNCAHLGCPVSWFPQSQLFMCPCHGGVYYADGKRASGPPPRGLFQMESRIRHGRLEVRAPHYPTLNDPLKKDEA
jgi:menaquinol-cytochrome c reductase iron-sulfur subunit